MLAAIDKAILALPQREGAHPDLARTLAFSIFMMIQTHEKPSSQRRIKADLDRLAQLASELRGHIATGMCHEATTLVDLRLQECLMPLSTVAEAARAASAGVKIDDGGRGAPHKLGAYGFAVVAADTYEQYTGARPTITTSLTGERRGRFVSFVRAIFDAAGIKANAANFAKWAARDSAERAARDAGRVLWAHSSPPVQFIRAKGQ
jgi:hypothetical protein